MIYHLAMSKRLLIAAQCSSVMLSASGVRTSYPASRSSLHLDIIPYCVHFTISHVLNKYQSINYTKTWSIHHILITVKLFFVYGQKSPIRCTQICPQKCTLFIINKEKLSLSCSFVDLSIFHLTTRLR